MVAYNIKQIDEQYLFTMLILTLECFFFCLKKNINKYLEEELPKKEYFEVGKSYGKQSYQLFSKNTKNSYQGS